MPTPVYRITISTTVVVRQGDQERLEALEPGAVLVPTSATDRAGMIEAMCDEKRVRIFARDLDERSERVEIKSVEA